MGYSDKTAKKILKLCKQIGIEEASIKLDVKIDSVRRACSKAEGKEKFKSVPELVKSVGDPSGYLNDVHPNWRADNSDGSSRVLVIGDLHTPFDYEPYFEHCIAVYDKYECNRVVFIGDCVDNHYSSYNETDADGELS